MRIPVVDLLDRSHNGPGNADAIALRFKAQDTERRAYLDAYLSRVKSRQLRIAQARRLRPIVSAKKTKRRAGYVWRRRLP